MIRLIIITALLTVTALQIKAQKVAGEFQSAAIPVEWNRELPRTQTICYDSQMAALESSRGHSKYFQPIGEQWVIKDKKEARVFSHNYKMPFVWVDREIFLHIGSVNGAYDLMINGKYAGYNQCGATPAEFDITAYSSEGMNTLEIVVYKDYTAAILEDNQPRDPTVSGEVYVLSQPKIRIRDYTARVNFEGADATVELGVILKSHLLNPKSLRVFFHLLSPSGEEVALGHRDTKLDMRQEDTVRFFINVPRVEKWSHETPKLYTLILKTQHTGRYEEYIAYKIGIKNVRSEGGKLLLNSHELHLSAIEYKGAADRKEAETKLKEVKAAGYNTVRLDRPQPEYFYDMCDQLGVYVINQAAVRTASLGDSRAKGGNPSNDPQWIDSYKDRARTMYYTSQSHPSVIMFSLAGPSSNGYNLYESYLEMKNIERSRPVVYLNAAGEWNSDGVSGVFEKSQPDPTSLGADMRLTGNKLHLENRYHIAEIVGELRYTAKQGSKIISQGSIPIHVNPLSGADYTIPTDGAKAGKEIKFNVTFHGNLPVESILF